MRRSATLPALGALLLAASAPLAQDADWSGLPPGEYAVGFSSTWLSDPGRTYRTAFDDGATYGAEKAPRPILLNLWYPAKPAAGAAAMPYGGYFEIGSTDPAVDRFARALVGHAREVVVLEVFGVEDEGDLDEDQSIALGVLLERATACRRDAPPAQGSFPLVLYHSGAGSSYEDNALLCEYLASHGYVVAGSAYPDADGSSLGIDGDLGSAEDMQVITRHLAGRPFVDWERIAIAGHSAGAQAALRYAARPGCPADAIVLLDTTQDYYGLSIPLFEKLVGEVLDGREHIDQPFLVTTGPEAAFRLLDRLDDCDRIYLTAPAWGTTSTSRRGCNGSSASPPCPPAPSATGSGRNWTASRRSASSSPGCASTSGCSSTRS